MHSVVVRGRVIASLQAVWITRDLGPQPEFALQANILVQRYSFLTGQ